MHQDNICPCGSNLSYHHCCERLHLGLDSGQSIATTAEQLMRSRYSAFAMKNFDYIIKTHHPEFLGELTLEQLQQGPHPHWLALEVLDSQELAIDNGTKQASVTFKAWYKLDGQIDAIYERSAFIYTAEHWYYTTGQQMQSKLPSRNDPCICRSGKKFKQCCQSSR